ncbi:MAG: hypothetical protein ACI9O4_000370 [Chitinophagales bacterium]|jgi:hypothetical protein
MHVNGQSIRPFETTINFDEAQRPCIQVNLDPEPKMLKKAWKDYLKKNYAFKLKEKHSLTNKGFLSAEEITIEQISLDAIDFFTQINSDESGSELNVFARHGYDIYINEKDNPIEYEALHEVLESFMKYYLPTYYENEINEMVELVNSIVSDLDHLKKKNVGKAQKINKLNEDVYALEKEEEVYQLQLKVAEIKLADRKEKLQRIRNQL